MDISWNQISTKKQVTAYLLSEKFKSVLFLMVVSAIKKGRINY